jgi:hypothetical protein
MEIHNPGDYTAADAFALAMLCVMLLSMGVIAMLFFLIRKSSSRRDAQVDELLEELARDEKPQPAASTPAPILEDWEKEPDWWKK